MVGFYSGLSLRLYQVLDIIGASENDRARYWEKAKSDDIIRTIYRYEDATVYTFGSSCEGTTTYGLHSDMDRLFCVEFAPVIEKIEDALEYGFCLLMISDTDTMPGYFKLQMVGNGVPETISENEIDDACASDTHGRICLKHADWTADSAYTEMNGPAHTKQGDESTRDEDVVFAHRCVKIPSNFKLFKENGCSWPSKSQLQILKSFGCFFVGASHPKSKRPDIEWRISFSLQERTLMLGLNPTQHKCYILLKLIKKDIIETRVGMKSISSYHCKTCLFHVIEKSRPGFWTRRNLIEGVCVCLSVLLRWVRAGNCPNYFIPEENMFDRVDPETLNKVEIVLKNILKNRPTFLLSIQCDNISSVLFENNLTQIRKSYQGIDECDLHVSMSVIHYEHRNEFLRTLGSFNDPIEYLSNVYELYQFITTANPAVEHSPHDVKIAVQSFASFIQLQIAQSIASIMCSRKDAFHSRIFSRVLEHCIFHSDDCDVLSSKLILASCLLKADMFDLCEEILLICESCLESFVLSVCGCPDTWTQSISYTSLLKLQGRASLSHRDFRRNCTTGCMLFFPAQANLVHHALHYEMYRSFHVTPGSSYEGTSYWFSWILVDSQVYLFFLQYLLYSKTKNTTGTTDAINNLVHLIRIDKYLGHKETGYNLLGWILIQEKRWNDALCCFRMSWGLRPEHNAAKWHLCVMLATICRRPHLSIEL